ncbi:MAG: hypothetical protein ACYC5O_03405 [Anaerolineae bacterium]
MPGEDTIARVSVPAAATRLNLSVEAVRKRIHRGSLAAEKVDGRWLVLLPSMTDVHDGVTPVMATPSGSVQDVGADDFDAEIQAYRELVATLQSEVEFLRRELQARGEELRRRDEVMADLLRGITPPPADRAGTWPFWRRREK